MEEDRRIFLHKTLKDFRESSSEESLSFSSDLTSTERKYLHRIATELNLISKSVGSGSNRFITVRKKQSSVLNEESTLKAKVVEWGFPPKAIETLRSKDMEQSILELRRSIELAGIDNSSMKKRFVRNNLSSSLNRIRESYFESESNRRNHPSYHSVMQKRSLLPAFSHRNAVCNIIKAHQIVLISGETGCGKSTQVPQYLLEDESIGSVCRIIITQPRRISAIALAERIASERCEQVGGTIGYNIRLESQMSANTQVTFVTPGVLLRKLIEDPNLDEFSHIIVDEAHERDRYTEFLLIILRDICERRRSLKLVLMSATMHTASLRAYFGEIPQINVGGSVFPVQEFYLEHILKFINYSGKFDESTKGFSRNNATTVGHRFYCSICSCGPFLSAEELGTHAAFCFPPTPVTDEFSAKRGLTQGKQLKLQSLANHLKLIQSNVVAQAPVAVADSDENEVFGSQLQNLVNNNEEEREGEGEGEDDENYDSLSDDSFDVGTAMALPDQKEIGQDKFLMSEESVELNSLLKQYQRDTEEFDDNQIDYDLLIALLRYIYGSEFGKDGSILVFLPGWDEISRLHRALLSSADFNNNNDQRIYKVLQLHSGIPRKDQNLVFQPSKEEERKIILSTNIAETSLTIDDVTVVIDVGRAKEKVYDPYTKLSYLKSAFISQASARQRKGRAGRTRAGVCFHLYSQLRGKHLPEFQVSELLRMPLEELALQAKCLGLAPGKGEEHNSVKSFIMKAMDPPHELSLQHGISLLQSLGCLDESEALTDLGDIVGKMPMNPRLGKMLITACLFGCGSSAASLAAIMSYRDPFVMPTSDQQRDKQQKTKLTFSQFTFSDQFVVLRSLETFTATMQRAGHNDARQFCDQHDFSFATMMYLMETSQQLLRSLKDMGVSTSQAPSLRNSGNMQLILSILSCGLYPDVAIRHSGQTMFSTEKGSRTKIHPSSVNAKAPIYKSECRQPLEVICFQDLIELNPHLRTYRIGGANYLMVGTSPMSTFSLLLSSGNFTVTADMSADDGESALVAVDRWILIRIKKSDLSLLLQCRELLKLSLLKFSRFPDQFHKSASARVLDRILGILADEQTMATKFVKTS